MNVHKPKGTYADYLAYIEDSTNRIDDKKFVFELSKKPNDASLKDPDGKVVQHNITTQIPMVGSVYFKGKDGRGYIRRIRYVEGEKSIYVDEQVDSKGNALVNPTPVVAEFIRGKKEIDGTDTVKLAFFMTWDINGTKEDRDSKKTAQFHLVDTSKLASAGRKAHKQEFDAVNWCYNAKPNKLMGVATLLMNHEQLMQNIEDIRYNLVMIAKRNPPRFTELMDDPKTERNYIVRQAIERGLLVVNQNINGVCYAENPNAPLSVAQSGKDPVYDFVTKSMTGGDVGKFYADIENYVNPPVEEVKAIAYVPKEVVAEKSKADLIDESELRVLYKSGIEKGVIEVKPPYWKKFKGKSFKSEEAFIQGLKDNADYLSLFKKELELVEA